MGHPYKSDRQIRAEELATYAGAICAFLVVFGVMVALMAHKAAPLLAGTH